MPDDNPTDDTTDDEPDDDPEPSPAESEPESEPEPEPAADEAEAEAGDDHGEADTDDDAADEDDTDDDRPRRPSTLRRYGPLGAVAVVIALVIAVSVVAGGGNDDDDSDQAATAGGAGAPTGELPEGVVTWTKAQEDNLDVTWPDTCDTSSGLIAIPFFFRTECFAEFDGDNGGETSDGVTADSIKVVAWLPNDDDPIMGIVRQALGINDTVDEIRETYEGLVQTMQDYYQTYGRTVDLEFVESSGSMLDPVASRADAVEAASKHPFAVLGGPLLGSAWTDELHARGVVCLFCPGIPDEAPSSFGILPSGGQIDTHVAAYVKAKLLGRPAEFAGDALQDEDRTFGILYQGSDNAANGMKDHLEDEGVDVAEVVAYPLDPTRAQELAASGIARLKEAGVTSVIVHADPITLPAFLNEATEQDWFPEWVLAAYQFSDSSVFGRTFDQQQWEHAFGISFLPPQAPPEITPPYRLYEWYHGEPPPADNSLILTYPSVALLFTGLEYAGPDLTVEHFRDGLFAWPPTPRAVTEPSVDYGTDLWGQEDYAGIDDMVELWWDPTAEGKDENGDEGRGHYRYVDGGRRYMPEDYSRNLAVFDPENAPTEITEPPAPEVPPDYPSPAESGEGG
jgi:hypothetical protein